MIVPTLNLTPAQRERIESAAEAAYPNECCGIIYGTENTTDGRSGRFVDELEPADNDFPADQQHHRFAISPAKLMLAEKKCRGGRLVLGFYHSHPDHPAEPSEYDRSHAWPFYSYVIVAVRSGTAAELTSWMLDENTGTFQPQLVTSLSDAT
jgi:proteasome lid subunit RPN8/RPN11